MPRFSRELELARAGLPWIGFVTLCSLSALLLLLVVGERRSEALERRERRRSDDRVSRALSWSPRRPRNVILMIGDGMGLAQLTLASHKKGPLAMQRMPVAGYSYTQSLRDFVTDSAAGATALASGERVVNGVVGQRPDGTPTRTVLEVAEERGLWTGLVATSRITHATPAAMVAHVGNREAEKTIAAQIAASDIEVLLGGGWDMFRGPRTDGRDLVQEMTRRGYVTVHTARELARASTRDTTRLLGLFSAGPMPKRSEGRSPSLQAMAVAALRVLSRSPGGFFLMIEGSQIDWGGHQNDSDYVMHETADFDDTLEEVLRFLGEAGITGETLVLVTADHETGGLALNANPRHRLGVEPRWTTPGHTGVPVPVFARGPGARGFSGIQDHASIGRELKRLVGAE